MAQGDHTRRRKANKRRPADYPHMMIQEDKQAIRTQQEIEELYEPFPLETKYVEVSYGFGGELKPSQEG